MSLPGETRKHWAVYLLCTLLLGLEVTGCVSMGEHTHGVSGPVAWRATDVQWQAYAFGRQQTYFFTLVLQESQGTAITFTKLTAVLHNAADSLPAYWEQTGQWFLTPYGELQLPLGSTRYCPYTRCRDAGPALVPVWHLILLGTDAQGQSVRLVLDIRLPYIPNMVRTY